MTLISLVALNLLTSTIHGSVTYRPDYTATITSKEGKWGDWSEWIYCNRGHYGYEIYLQSEQEQDSGDDTGANAFELRCDDGEVLTANNNAPWSQTEMYGSCNDKQAIKGFATKVEDACGDCDDTALNAVRTYCTDGEEFTVKSIGDWGSWGGNGQCPYGSIVCGFRQKVESDADCGADCDDTALNGIQLACCKNSRSYSNGEGYWDTIYTGNKELKFAQKITVGITHYVEETISRENAASLELSLSQSMSFSFNGIGASTKRELKGSISQKVTSTSVKGTTTTKTEQRQISCGAGSYGLYQFKVTAQETGLNNKESPFKFNIQTGDYWCSTKPNESPNCPPGYCNHADNCQTCVGNPIYI